MSVSSHLTPEPERRLWLILESMRQAAEHADWKIAALTAFAAAELAWLRPGFVGSLALWPALPLGVFAFSPLSKAVKQLKFLEARRGKPGPDDNLVAPEDITKYTHGELIFRMDRYLGGGVTATAYYEDLVGQILVAARLASVKRSLLVALSILVGLGQLGLLNRNF